MNLAAAAVKILFAFQATRQAAVAGVVRAADTGDPVVNASVAMPELGRTAISDTVGRYELRGIPAGPQHVSVRAIGYAPRTLHALVSRAGVLEIDVSLSRVTHRLPVVAVRPPMAVRGTAHDDPFRFPDRSVSIAAVTTHPLFSEPDVFQALGGGEVVVQPESPNGMHIRGGAADQTAFTLDGVPVIGPYHTSGMFSAWNPDALSSVSVSTVAPTGIGHALGGVVAATTRAPGENAQMRGSVSNTQTRLTVHGPMGPAGVLLSVRSSPPSSGRRRDGSYLRSESQDWIAKLELPLLRGELRVLGYGNDNEVLSAAAVGPDDATSAPFRNAFEWKGQSFGAEWRGHAGSSAWRVATWSAASGARALWADGRVGGAAPTVPELGAESKRRDVGFEASVARELLGGTTLGGMRLERMTTGYQVESGVLPDPGWTLATNAPIATLFARHTRAVTSHAGLELGVMASSASGRVRLGPHARAQFSASKRLTLSASYARLHQFAQSLRNTESVVGNIFPAELFVGATNGAAGLPTARSDVRIAAAEFRPLTGTRIGLQLYDRSARGLVFVGARETGPFATGSFAVGTGTARGLAADAALTSTRVGMLLSYGAQRVRQRHGDSSFVPEHGIAHSLEGGATVFPTRTSSVRLGVASGWGRRATPIVGGFEWEACNLRDGGCEFAGSPRAQSDALGQSQLPPYVRVDLGARKHWHIEVGGRDVEVALFGAMTNILNRRNVLAYGTHPVTGERLEIEMRPQAPLVVGLDWRY